MECFLEIELVEAFSKNDSEQQDASAFYFYEEDQDPPSA